MRNNTPPREGDFGPTVLSLAVPGTAMGPRRTLWWVAAFAVVSGILLATVLWLLRVEAIRSGERLTAALAGVIAEQTTRSVQTVDERLRFTGHKLQNALQGGGLTRAAGSEMLRAERADLPYVRAFWVIDPSGATVYHSEVAEADVMAADREYFTALIDPGTAGRAHVGPLVRSRTTGGWQMTVSRALRNASGDFQGVIVAAIEPAYFQSVWSGLDVGRAGIISLLHRSGQLMMRSPPDESALGRDFSRLRLFTEGLRASPNGFFHRRSVIDEVERVVAYRTLLAYPQLVVLVGSSYWDLLAPWRRFALLTGGIWLLSVLGAAILGRQVQRQSQRRRHVEQRFAQLAQAMPQIVFITDARGVVEYVNERWSETTGFPIQQALGAHWYELAHPDDRQRAEEEMLRSIAAGEPVQVELRLLHADGFDRWQLVRARPNRGDAGQVVSWYGTSTDVHDLKLAQEQLQGQADMLGLAGQLARLGGWELDLATGRFSLSDIAAVMLDLPLRSAPTLGEMYESMGPQGRANAAATLQRCIDHGEDFDIEGKLTTPAGRVVWIRSMGQPVRDADGNVVRIQGAQQDITQRVRLLQEIRDLNATLEERIAQRTRELERQEALFRTLAEQAPLPIWTVDPEGEAMFFSSAWYELVGGEPPRWTRMEWLELIHPDDVQAVLDNWARCRVDGSTCQGTRRLRARDGTFHTTTYRATPVRGDDGQIAFWVGIDTDITDITANEAALRLANEQLRSFSYSVSHDLQSPLQRIGSFAQLLERELLPLPAGSRAAHYLQRIRANVEEMVQLVQGLLSLAQVSQADVVRARVDLTAIATDILARLRAESPERHVRWQVEPGLTVLGDVRLMRAVMENLLGNAWKFTAQQEQAEITVGGSAELGEFFVRDNGAGFDMAHADKLFGTFQRLHRQSEFPGTGIGLATVARAVQRQGGTVRGEGEPGRGATFRFTMPVPAATPDGGA